MESDNVDMGISGGSSGSVSSRWNPTKEQISLLESLYKQGIRTPSADQIQQITGRLKAYGHIEGKNVFYWFQNHKARQRQKQKQDSMALNRYLLSNANYQPVFAPSCPNVVCSPYYLQQQSDLGFYQHYSNALLSGGFKRRARAEKMDNKTISCFCTAYEPHVSNEGNYFNMHKMRDSCDQEALPLFPLHPTGFLQHGKETTISYSDLTSAENSTNSSSSFDPVAGVEDGSCYKPFFDFFSGRAPSKS